MLKKKESVGSSAAALSNTINQGTIISGKIETDGNIRIDGTVKGDIHCKNKVFLGKTSDISGNIHAKNIDIEGNVKGDIIMEDTAVLKPTCKVEGRIYTKNIVIENGAQFNGSTVMGKGVKPSPSAKMNGSINGNQPQNAGVKKEASKSY